MRKHNKVAIKYIIQEFLLHTPHTYSEKECINRREESMSTNTSYLLSICIEKFESWNSFENRDVNGELHAIFNELICHSWMCANTQTHKHTTETMYKVKFHKCVIRSYALISRKQTFTNRLSWKWNSVAWQRRTCKRIICLLLLLLFGGNERDSRRKNSNVLFNVATKINSLTMHSYEVRMNGIEIDRIELQKKLFVWTTDANTSDDWEEHFHI